MDVQPSIRAAKFLATPLAFFLAGYSLNASHLSVPLLYSQPASVSTPIFTQIYRQGALVAVPSQLLSIAASGYLAYAVPEQRKLWAAAGLSLATIIPWTFTVMMPGIKRLIAIGESSVEQEKVGRDHVPLLQRWVAQNYARAAVFFASGMCGLVAITESQLF